MVKNWKNSKKTGFIVHPFETADGSYHAGYGKDLNRTTKGFKTLGKAKAYLKTHKVRTALYDSPSGDRRLKISGRIAIRRKVRRRRSKSMWSF